MNLLVKTLMLLLVAGIAITLQNSGEDIKNRTNEHRISDLSHQKPKRAIFKKKVGPVRQIFGLIFEQWNDTRLTINTINTLINDSFLPENSYLTTTTTPNPNLNVSTKPPPFKITRSEAGKIVRRNLRGLARLINIELRDAFKQSKVTNIEHKKNVSKEVGKFL